MEMRGMDTPLFNNSLILRKSKACALAASLALLSLATPLQAAETRPTAAEISKARAQCAVHKQKVRALESANENDPQLPSERTAWASACGHAQDLISAASGIPPPAPAPDPNAPAPAPAPTPNAPAN
jgi:uncharacterized membrane protein